MRRVISAGTLGPVLLVEAPDGGDTLAVKLITLEPGDDARALEAALAEAVTTPVPHPGMLPVLATGSDQAGVYLVTPFVDAPTLESRLRGGRQPLAQVVEWLSGPADALDAAHQQGRRHGALHPRDILLGRSHGIMTGLDISPALEALGMQAPVRVPYTAPERASGKPWDARADQYSLAMIALDALSGRRLIAGTIPAFDRWTLADTPAEDARLHEVFGRALHPDPEARFASVAEWLEALIGAAEPASELSRFTRDGVIPAATPEVRRGTDAELLDDAMPLALFPAEEPASDSQAEPAAPAAPADMRDADERATVSPTGEWLVASMPDDAPPLADTGPMPIQSVSPDDETMVAPPPVTHDAPEDDLAFRHVGGNDEPVELADSADTWEPPDDVADDESERRGSLFLVLALLVVGVVAYGTWRSLTGPDTPPTTASSEIEEPAGDAGGAEDAVPSPAPLEEDTLRPSPDDLAQGAPPPAESPAAEMPAAPPRAEVPVARTTPPAAPVASRATPPSPAAAPQASAGATPAPAAAAPELPLSPDLGRVLIRSSPAGQVRINGRPRGQTPVVLRDLPFGSYVVTISRPGYEDAVREIDVLPSQPVASLAIDLVRSQGASGNAGARPTPPPPASQAPSASAQAPPAAPASPGSLYIVSRPSDGRLYVNGQFYGSTPAVVPGLRAGRHVVRVEMRGYRTWEGTVQVQPGQRARVDATLLQESR